MTVSTVLVSTTTATAADVVVYVVPVCRRFVDVASDAGAAAAAPIVPAAPAAVSATGPVVVLVLPL